MSEPTTCLLPWIHLFVDGSGRAKPCCRFEMPKGTRSTADISNGLEPALFSPINDRLRADMEAGRRPEGCRRCWEEESSGKASLRQRYDRDQRFQELAATKIPALRSLEISLSNECNLACRMCNSLYSRRWYEQEHELYGKAFAPQRAMQVDIEKIQASLRDVGALKVTGGEPLVMSSFAALLKWLVDENLARKIDLSFVTNCTIPLSSELTDRLNAFRTVDVTLSLDSIDAKEWEYIRWPSSLERVLKNVEGFVRSASDSWAIGIRPTVSILNVSTIIPTLAWFRTLTDQIDKKRPFYMNPTHLTDPSFLKLTVLPDEIKAQVRALVLKQCQEASNKEIVKFGEYVIRFMDSADETGELPKLQRYLETTDRKRNQSFIGSYPHYSELFRKRRVV